MITVQHYTIKHILNKNLNAKLLEGEECYALYVQVIIYRKNYMFRSMLERYFPDLESISLEDQRILEFEIELLTSIIDYELKHLGEKFDVPGLSKRYNYYRRSVVDVAERMLIRDLEISVNSGRKPKYKGLFNYKYEPGKFGVLLEVVEKILPENMTDNTLIKYRAILEFWEEYQKMFPKKENYGIVLPTVFDWIVNDHKSIFGNILKYNSINNLDLLLQYIQSFDYTLKNNTINR